MKKIDILELSDIAGGCQACPVVPGACVVVGASTLMASYFGLGAYSKEISLASFAVLMGYIGYRYLNTTHSHSHEAP